MKLRRIMLALISVAAMVCMVFGLVACGETEDPPVDGSGNGGTTTIPCLSNGEHEWGEWTITTNASCTTVGEKWRECLKCGSPENAEIARTEHKAIHIAAQAPTCAEVGYTAGVRCETCNTKLSGIEEIPATGNHITKIVEGVEPTCTTVGYRAGKQCTVCGVMTLEREEIPQLEHQPDVWTAKDATNHSSKCRLCGDEFTEKHVLKDWNYIEGTCLVASTQVRACECGYTETVQMGAAAHDWQYVICEDNSETGEGQHRAQCKRCNELGEISAHRLPENFTVKRASTCTEPGYESKACLDGCGYAENVGLPTSGHDWGDVISTTQKTGSVNVPLNFFLGGILYQYNSEGPSIPYDHYYQLINQTVNYSTHILHCMNCNATRELSVDEDGAEAHVKHSLNINPDGTAKKDSGKEIVEVGDYSGVFKASGTSFTVSNAVKDYDSNHRDEQGNWIEFEDHLPMFSTYDEYLAWRDANAAEYGGSARGNADLWENKFFLYSDLEADHELVYIARAATCHTPLVVVGYCDVCGQIVAETVEIYTPHTWEEGYQGNVQSKKIEARAATCTDAGVHEGFACGVCGELNDDAKIEVPATGHALDYNEETGECTVGILVHNEYGHWYTCENGCGYAVAGYEEHDLGELGICECGYESTTLLKPSTAFVYDVNKTTNEATLTGLGNWDSENLIIPAFYEEEGVLYPVTAIGGYLVSGKTNIKNVVIPDTVKEIRDNAFFGTTTPLETVTIGTGLRTIGAQAFYFQKNLTTVTIYSNNLRSIGSMIFGYTGTYGPEKVGTITLKLPNFTAETWALVTKTEERVGAGGNNWMGGITAEGWGEVTYNYDYKNVVIIFTPALAYEMIDDTNIRITGMGTYELANGVLNIPQEIDGYTVKEIAAHAFEDNMQITEIVIPDSVEVIGDSAFGWAYSVKKVTIGNGIKEIKGYAFATLTALQEVHLGWSGELTLRDYSFNSLGSNVMFYFDGTTTDWASVTKEENWCGFGNEVKVWCSDEEIPALDFDKETGTVTGLGTWQINGGTLSIPETIDGVTVVAIGNEAFKDNTDIRSLVLPDTLRTIGEEAFSGLTGLRSVTWSQRLMTIGDKAFYNTNSLQTITLPDSVQTIGTSAFEKTDMEYVNFTIGAGIKSIGDSAFKNWGASWITINGIPTYIGTDAFAGVNNWSGATIEFYGTTPQWKEAVGDREPWGDEDMVTLQCNDILLYTLDQNNRATITGLGYVAPAFGYQLNIPSEIEGYTVTKIAEGAFNPNMNWNDETYTDLHERVQQITWVTLPGTLREVEDYAFYGLNIDTLYINVNGDPVTLIGEGTFGYEGGNLTVYINADIQLMSWIYMVTGIGGQTEYDPTATWMNLFDSVTVYANETQIWPVPTAGGDIELPTTPSPVYWFNNSDVDGGVKITGVMSYFNSEYTGGWIYIPEEIYGKKVLEIADNAFYANFSMPDKSMWYIPDTVTKVGNDAFCYNMGSELTFCVGKNLTDVGERAFGSYYSSVTINVYFRGTQTEWNELTAGWNSNWSGNATLNVFCLEKEIELPTEPSPVYWFNNTNIEGGVKVTGLTNYFNSEYIGGWIYIPEQIWGDDVLTIGESAFYNKGAYEWYIPDTVTRFDQSAFYDFNDNEITLCIGKNLTFVDFNGIGGYSAGDVRHIIFRGTEDEWNELVQGWNSSWAGKATYDVLCVPSADTTGGGDVGGGDVGGDTGETYLDVFLALGFDGRWESSDGYYVTFDGLTFTGEGGDPFSPPNGTVSKYDPANKIITVDFGGGRTEELNFDGVNSLTTTAYGWGWPNIVLTRTGSLFEALNLGGGTWRDSYYELYITISGETVNFEFWGMSMQQDYSATVTSCEINGTSVTITLSYSGWETPAGNYTTVLTYDAVNQTLTTNNDFWNKTCTKN